jgi:hypothetical protein
VSDWHVLFLFAWVGWCANPTNHNTRIIFGVLMAIASVGVLIELVRSWRANRPAKRKGRRQK